MMHLVREQLVDIKTILRGHPNLIAATQDAVGEDAARLVGHHIGDDMCLGADLIKARQVVTDEQLALLCGDDTENGMVEKSVVAVIIVKGVDGLKRVVRIA